MAKKTTKKSTKKAATKKTSKKVSGRKPAGRGKGLGYRKGDAEGKSLVIVESPAKAKTINKYLGAEYLVLASVGHVRDLPSKAPKGEKQPVPGVDLKKRFTPSYEVLKGKEAVVSDLKKAAKDAIGSGGDVWFATDLDREGEAIAWHLAQELGVKAGDAKRVIFGSITKAAIEQAFHNPHPIDEDRVNAQQARRILDRIVGYQVSPLLWKKVARGLSAGRVQSVAVRLVVEREQEIDAFVPDEFWSVTGCFALDEAKARKFGPEWSALLSKKDEKGNGPTVKEQNAWLAGNEAIKAELVEVGGDKFEIGAKSEPDTDPADLTDRVREVVALAGLKDISSETTEDDRAKGPARFKRTISGTADPSVQYAIDRIETKRTTSKAPGPFITSTLQQQASNRIGFGAQRTMRAAQGLYEGVNIPGEGPTGLITYMRTDSTYIAPEAISSVRSYIDNTFGKDYLPEKPNFFSSSNKAAQEAHEAIRPTDPSRTPDKVKKSLTEDQFKVYKLIWERFVASQMTPAKWDSTSVYIKGGTDPKQPVTFRAGGRTLVFDGFYRVTGVPTSSDEQTLPKLEEGHGANPFAIDPTQKFTSPPPRYTEASLIKTLESEGIGRPSTYASIISVIQDRNYVEQINRRFHATDLGEVVTAKLIEAFPNIMDLGYTRDMESQLDKVEEEHLDWIDMLERFYGPFAEALERAHEELQHAKAEIVPAPDEYRCETCGAGLVYRFGKNGRFLSCSTYPACTYAVPCDREGRPKFAEYVNITCPVTGRPLIKKSGRFGDFLATPLEEGEEAGEVGVIVNIDKKGFATPKAPPPLETDMPCPICESPLNLREGARGPWLGCSRFPKCRGRGKWTELDEDQQKKLELKLKNHLKDHPVPILRTLDGRALTDEKGKPLKDAPKVADLLIDSEEELERLRGVAIAG
ncbi:MAG: type I DNA topoisomerase [Phycisphaera sp.]|nr:MAG: type I DNA topoisomerase [Phycisphaera sp.]